MASPQLEAKNEGTGQILACELLAAFYSMLFAALNVCRRAQKACRMLARQMPEQRAGKWPASRATGQSREDYVRGSRDSSGHDNPKEP